MARKYCSLLIPAIYGERTQNRYNPHIYYRHEDYLNITHERDIFIATYASEKAIRFAGYCANEGIRNVNEGISIRDIEI